MIMQQFYVGPNSFDVLDVFLNVFWWIYCYNKYMDKSTRFRQEAETSRRKRVLLSILILTIDPSKDTEKYIADD